ncbi:MAG: SPFH domain-containing protein [Planctomycetes bacterium]|nr:SPFH domain-containing protein [Planctomycetota bacterium]
MAVTGSRPMWFPYFKGRPTDHIIRYSGGRRRGEGPGLAFFYWQYDTQVVAVPTQSQDVNFVFNELSADHQEITLQGQVTFRLAEPRRAAELFDFSIDPVSYRPLSEDRDKVGRRIANLVQVATRDEITPRPLEQALAEAPRLAGAVTAALRGGPGLAEMGAELLTVEFLSVRPTPEVAKALEAELRESLLRRADIAVYARRAATVDEERTIREKELAGEKTLEEQRREMIALQGANALEEARNAASARAVAADAEADFQRKRLDVFRDVDPRSLLALAMRELADNAGNIGNLTITSDILASLLDGRGAERSGR